MSIRWLAILCLLGIIGCKSRPTGQPSTEIAPLNKGEKRIGGADEQQQIAIRRLIDRLVFDLRIPNDQPVYSPGVSDDSREYQKRYSACQAAFSELLKMKGLAFPNLVEHLRDKRPSINFRNHLLGHTVGDACHWNIYCQLVDRPDGYSEYGLQRKGRDGKFHEKPYWSGSPFDEAGGIKEWLEKNKELNYVEMQIKCVQWLLDGEKKIGAPDPESYFLNILPLEIRILERRAQNGEDVTSALKGLLEVRDKKQTDKIPRELLP